MDIHEHISPPEDPVSTDYENPLSAHSAHATVRLGGLRLTLFESRARASTTPAYTPDNGVYDADVFNLNTLLVGAVSYTKEIGGIASTSTLTLSRHELDPESGYWNVYSNLKRSYKYAYGSMMKLEEQLSWKPMPAVTLTTGGTYERFFAIPQTADLNAPITSHETPGTILGTDLVDELVKLRYSNVAAFGQIQYAINPGFVLTAGAREDYNTRYGSSFNPRMGIVARPTTSTTVKLLYGRAFLAPSPYQAFTHYGSFYSTDGGETYASNYWHLPNPDLSPQRKETVEANLLQSLGRHFQVSASAFYSHLRDLIKSADADRAYSGSYLGWPVDYIDFPVNEGRAFTYGGTIGLDYLRVFGYGRRVSAHGSLAMSDGRVREDEQTSRRLELPGMTPLEVRAGLDLDWGAWSLAPRIIAAGAQRLVATVDTGSGTKRRTLDGYAVVDVSARRSLTRTLDVFVVAENVFDRRYRHINTRAYLNPEELVGAPQNPRRVTVGVDLRIR